MRTLRARLFAATLAALALTLALTIAIGAVLTRRQVDKSQATRSRAGPTTCAAAAPQPELHQPGHRRRATCASSSSRAHACVAARAERQRASSDGKTTFEGTALPLLVPAAALARALAAPVGEPALRRRGGRSCATCCSPALVGAAFAAALSFFVARSIVAADPARRGRSARARAEEPPDAAARGGHDRARVARAGVQRDGRAARRLARGRARLPALGQPRAEDAADGDPRLRRGARRRRVRRRRGGARRSASRRGRLERLVRDLLDLARMNRSEFSVSAETGRPRGGRARGRAPARGRGARVRRRADGGGRRGVGRGATTTGCCRSRRTSSRTRCARRRPAARSPCAPGDAQLVVADTGPGIPPEDVPHAFERFYLYDKFGKDRPVGSGLGLAIVQQLATAMGGDVRVESEPGGDDVRRRAYGRRREVSTTSKSAPVSAPSACSWSFDQCGLGRARHVPVRAVVGEDHPVASSSPARRCAPAAAAARCRRSPSAARAAPSAAATDRSSRSRSGAPDRCTRAACARTVKRSAWSMRPVDASPLQRARPGRIGSPAASADVHAGRAAARSSAGSRSRPTRPPSRPPVLVQRVELVERAGVAVDDQRVTVAVVEVTGAPSIGTPAGIGYGPLSLSSAYSNAHPRLRRRLAVHDDVRDADPRAVPEARAEVGVHGAADADRRDQRRRVRRDRQLVDRLVPDARRREDRAAAELRRRRRRPIAARPATSAAAASSFTVAGVAPPSRPRVA